MKDSETKLRHLAEDYSQKNNGKVFFMNSNGTQISEYIQQRKESYAKSKEREREASKVKT